VEMSRLARCGVDGGHSDILVSAHAYLQRRPLQFRLSCGARAIKSISFNLIRESPYGLEFGVLSSGAYSGSYLHF
jgi:hypothetical protein